MRTVEGRPITVESPAPPELLAAWPRLLELRERPDMLEERLRLLLGSWRPAAEDFLAVPRSYSRNVLLRHDSGYEAMIARWHPGAQTLIHGHPAYGFYLLLSGQLRVETFSLAAEERIKKEAERVWLVGDYVSIRGEAGRFDNGIHRITALTESLSFHLYSDDALKGVCFEDSAVIGEWAAPGMSRHQR